MKPGLSIAVLFFFISLSITSPAQKQAVKFNLVTGTSGISLGKVNGITSDKYGFIWLSDQTNRCIIRYSGSHMTKYQNDPKNPNSLGGFYPECLFADSSGNIWIGFYGMGLDKFDPGTNSFTHFRKKNNDPQSLSNDSVSAVLIDHLGKVWVGTSGGLDQLDPTTGKSIHYKNKADDPSSLSCDIVRAIYEDKAGDIWIGTGLPFEPFRGGGLNKFNRSTGTFTRYLHDPKDPNSLNGNTVRAIFEDSYGNFWIGTNGDGLHTLDRKTGSITHYPYRPGNPGQLSRGPINTYDDHITFITEDADRQLWIGTMLNGIIRYDPISHNVKHYGNINSEETASKDNRPFRVNPTSDGSVLKDNTSWWAHATPDGYVWFSTQNANLFKIDIYNSVVPIFSDITKDAVNSMVQENDHIFWYGTLTGLTRKDFNKGTIQQFVNDSRDPNSLSNNQVNSILKDIHGNIWVGTAHGLNLYDPKNKNFTRFYYNRGSTANWVQCLYAGKDSMLWVGTIAEGLYALNSRSGKFTNYRVDPGDSTSISDNLVTTIIEDETSELWIGTANKGGLNRLNQLTGKCKRYLWGIDIYCLYFDKAGVLWVGTQTGLFSYDRKSDSFKSIAEKNSANNIVQIGSIQGDKNDNLWLACETGVYMLNDKRDQVIRFGKENGFGDANNSFVLGSALTSYNGEIYFGFFGGYYAFFPEKLKPVPSASGLYLVNFWLNEQEVRPGEETVLKQPINNTNQIRLLYNQNVFSLSATSIDFRMSGEKQIYYRLEDYDKDWRTCSAEDRMQYYKVPPGKYVFRVRAANSGIGEWTEKTISIIISPPWWKTWWAYSIYGILFIALAFAFHRYQKTRLLRAERERARIKELAQAKEIEKAYHELRNTQAQLVHSEKMASLGELTAGIAHEIQNPLNFVNNFAEVNAELIEEMQEDLKTGKISEAVAIANDIKENQRKINHHGRRADAIVKGMLQHSRASNGIKEPTDLSTMADEYLRLSYHGFRAKEHSFNATLQTDFDKTVGKINIVPQDIARVLINLYTNAFYAVGEKKKSAPNGFEPVVSVSVKKIGEKVEIRVADNGNGIPQKVRDKIFQPFFTTKPTGQGTGLGLSLAYDIIKAHGGELKIETRENEGSTFIIEF